LVININQLMNTIPDLIPLYDNRNGLRALLQVEVRDALLSRASAQRLEDSQPSTINSQPRPNSSKSFFKKSCNTLQSFAAVCSAFWVLLPVRLIPQKTRAKVREAGSN
jgi:hypothetical protein